jgi:phage major head subunit gpT-like protein
MSTMLRSQFVDLFSEFLAFMDMMIFEEWEEYPPVYKEIFNVRSTKKPYIEGTGVSGFGLLQQKEEAEATALDRMYQMYDNRLTVYTYALKYKMSEECLEDDQVSVMEDAAKALGNSAAVTPDLIAVAKFNNGFTSTTDCADRVAFFATDHPTLVGTTQNEPTTGTDFSESSLELAINDFNTYQVNHRGRKLNIMPKIILNPTALQWKVDKVLNTQQQTNSANNDINAVRKRGLKGITWHHLSDPKAWFMGAAPRQTKLMWYDRKPFGTDHDVDIDEGVGITVGKFRSALGHFDWRGWWGSPGT